MSIHDRFHQTLSNLQQIPWHIKNKLSEMMWHAHLTNNDENNFICFLYTDKDNDYRTAYLQKNVSIQRAV